MVKQTMKTCLLSGNEYKATTENFYKSRLSPDGLHPYHKKFDNFRRKAGLTVSQLKELVNLIKS